MSRIEAAFTRCRAEGRPALIGYLTGFDPDRAGSLARLRAACAAGLDLLELGVAFSDPTADGPEIQAAMVRALKSGSTLAGVIELATALRGEFPELPIVLFSYANPLLRAAAREAEGAAGLCRSLIEHGIDGLLVVDLPPDLPPGHGELLRDSARAAGLDWIGLVAPTSTPHRRDRVLASASGFVYAVSLTGVTGAALDASSSALHEQLADLRARTDLPVAVGFGVRSAAQVGALAQVADGVVVGSALVRAGVEGVEVLAAKVRELRAACAGIC
ncbi:tryptophan synthase subunit alpha [Nannocystaceae bacterium ST9]